MNEPALEQARTLIDLQRTGQARELLQRVVAQDPHDAAALCLLAQACLADQDGPAALEAATSAVALAPDEEWPLRLAALAMARCRRRDEAQVYAELAVEVDPTNWRTHLVRAQIDLIANAVSGATVGAAGTAVRLAPQESQCHRVLGNAQLALNHRSEAEVALREALRLAPDDAAARNDLARAHLLGRNLGRAAGGFADAAALDPTDSVAAGNLDVVGARALRVVHAILWVVTLLVSNERGSASGPSRTALLVGWLVAAVALAGFGAHLWWGTRPRTVALAGIVARSDRMLVLWFAFLALEFVLLGLSTVVPSTARQPVFEAGVAALVIATGLTWFRSMRFRGARPAPGRFRSGRRR